MNQHTKLLPALLIAAGTANASAGIFTWFAGQGNWENAALWNGPVGQYPGSILDTATISGASSSATLTQNLSVGTLNILGSASVYSNGHSIFVNGDTHITGAGSDMTVNDTPALRDFDTDTLTITDGILVMYNGLAQFDEALIIDGGGVLGTGTIEMNSTSGNVDFDGGGGAIWATGAISQGPTLRITRTNTSTSRLDWTNANCSMIAWDAKTLSNELPYTGSLGGRISVNGSAGTARYVSAEGFVAGPGSKIQLAGSSPASNGIVRAPAIDSYGLIDVSGYGVIDSPIVALRGSVDIEPDSRLSIPATLLIFDSLDIDATGSDITIQLAGQGSTLNVTGGITSIRMGDGGQFDLDGAGDKTVNIADGSTLWLDVEALDYGANPSFGGTLNIAGTMHVAWVPPQGSKWWSDGEIMLDDGEITGRVLVNNGLLHGTGYIDAYVSNPGEIAAEGGTLRIYDGNLDGNQPPQFGTLRAQTGNLIINEDYDGQLHEFNGSMFVGNGNGTREMLSMGVCVKLGIQEGITGSMHLDSGVAVFKDFEQAGILMVHGTSMLRATGNQSEDRIMFAGTGINTIVGTLQVDGDTWFSPGSEFIGEGRIHATSSVKTTFFQEGSDLSDVWFASEGDVRVLSNLTDGEATVGSVTFGSSAVMRIDMGDFTDTMTATKLIARDQAALDGTLSVEWKGVSQAPVGHTVTVLQAPEITGAFQSIDFTGLGPNRRAYVTVKDTSVDVFVTCAADLNADGLSNFFDISAFLDLFNSQDPSADLNNDGVLNFFDISIYMHMYNMGC